MKPRHPIAGLQRHAATIPATEARAQLLVVSFVLTAFSLALIAIIVMPK